MKSTSTTISNSDNYLDEDHSLYDEGIEHELGSDEISITSSADITDNNFDNHHLNEKVRFPSVSNIKYDANLMQSSDPPWAGLTYESLRFPKYIKTSKKHKLSPRLNHLFLAQELNKESGSKTDTDEDDEERISDQQSILSGDNLESNSQYPGEILSMEFSKDGMYLAAAGRDGVLKIWKVISSPLARLEYTNNPEVENGRKKSKKSKKRGYSSALVFHKKPVKIFKGHSLSIISLDWSKNNFIITGSMDRTAKLWHVDRNECLHTFKLNDFVTALKFHPTDDRFFASGSLDNRVLLWSILENNIAYEKVLDDKVLVTSLTFTPDGLYLVVGGFNGSIIALETKGLYIVDRVEIKNTSLGKQLFPTSDGNHGNKITGVKAYGAGDVTQMPYQEKSLGNWNFLITTNDSKIRLINSYQKKLVTRFRGLTNNSSSIVASTSGDNNYIISGSEDHRCYVWENNNSIINNKLRQSMKELIIEGKQHISDIHRHKVYGKLFPDNKFVKRFLAAGTQKEKEDYVANENNSYTSFHAHHSRVNAAIFAPDNTRQLLELSDDIIYDLVRRGKACSFSNKGKTSKVALDGQIIVTADLRGLIRVFRQDSAYYYRKNFIEMCKQNNPKGCMAENREGLLSNTNLCAEVEQNQRECPTIDIPEIVGSLSPTSESFPLKKLHNRFRGSSNADQMGNIIQGSQSPSLQSTSTPTLGGRSPRVSRGAIFSGIMLDTSRTRSASPDYFNQETLISSSDRTTSSKSTDEKSK